MGANMPWWSHGGGAWTFTAKNNGTMQEREGATVKVLPNASTYKMVFYITEEQCWWSVLWSTSPGEDKHQLVT